VTPVPATVQATSIKSSVTTSSVLVSITAGVAAVALVYSPASTVRLVESICALSVTFFTVNVGTPEEEDPLAPVPTVAHTLTRFIPVNAAGIRKYALSEVVSAVVQFRETATYRIPKLDHARESGDTYRFASVPVFTSEAIEASAIPACVVDPVILAVIILLLSIANTPADTRVIVESVACHTSSDPTPSAVLVEDVIQDTGSHVQFVRVPDAGVHNAPPFVTIAPADPTATASAVHTPVQGVIPAQVVRSAS